MDLHGYTKNLLLPVDSNIQKKKKIRNKKIVYFFININSIRISLDTIIIIIGHLLIINILIYDAKYTRLVGLI